MRHVLALLLSIMLLSVLGCSSGSPTTPTGASNSQPTPDSLNYQVLSAGVMNLETGTVEPDREAEGYLNVTGLVGSNFRYTINGWSSPGVLDITLSLNNASSLTVNDVYIVFEELTGKKVMNQDGMIDIYGANDLDPFIAFRKESPTRAFPPGLDTEPLLLSYPGSGIYVSYFIIAHLGGNTGGVWNLTDWTATGSLYPSGGSSDVTVKVWDWQNDVSGVVADTTVLTGGYKVFIKSATPQIWGATIVNSAGAPVGDYSILVRAQSPASPTYSYYKTFTLEVVSEGTSHVSPVANITKPANDMWWDIGVAPDGPVYVCADHPETGNTDLFRTAIRFDNLLGNMTVINSGTGMNDPDAWGMYTTVWDKIDVLPNGKIVTNPMQGSLATWTVNGAVATDDICCYRFICGYDNVALFADVWDNDDAGGVLPGPVGMGYNDFGQTCLGPINENQGTIWMMDAATYGGGGLLSVYWATGVPFYNYDDIQGINSVAQTGNCIFFISGPNAGYLSLSGSWAADSYTSGILPVEIDTTGTLGTADGQFTGGLDVAIDNDGAILTLEDHGGGVYRFQKFGPDLTWIYSSMWEEATHPMRMDYDKADNMLYLLTNEGISICSVD
jgi:hypothetical protein